MNEVRKLKREELIMKRRGLNFVTDSVAESLNNNEEVMSTIEQETDNIAPKVVALLALNSACDICALRADMVKYCKEFQQSQGGKKANQMQEIDEVMGDSQFRSYICPNPGSSTNLGSKKQRLMFLEINREDEYSVLEIGKVADIVVVVMSCAESDVKGVKIDPDRYANAIDDLGYKALSLLRSQGLPGLIGVLQHLEKIQSKKQPQIKKLFQRYFESEFTNKQKFMNVNAVSAQSDINALLRQIAVLYPEEITWR